MNNTYSEEGRKNYEKAQAFSDKGSKTTALKYYLKAAEAGIVPAMVACGNLYLDGKDGIKKNVSKAMEWFQKAASAGNLTAMNNIGYVYETLENYEESLNWYKKAADLGNITAMMNLAGVYENNFNDKKSARQWIKKAESCKDLYSIKELAHYYSEADAIKNNIQKAIKFYEKAAKMGDVDSLSELGDLYFYIDEFDAAEHYYFEAAKMGDAYAMTNLGIILTNDYEDFEKAHFWLKKAVEGGNIYAVRMMGDLYAKFKQYHKALRWYRKSVALGEDAREDIHKVKKLLKTSKVNYKLRVRTLA